ncbi:hypothetical protein GA0115240_16572 [Streptomyces sp. DvalAA-14]|nr:hypothetical protein GA0115240_16572 [Streptomyces sp. DvalAA-14]
MIPQSETHPVEPPAPPASPPNSPPKSPPAPPKPDGPSTSATVPERDPALPEQDRQPDKQPDELPREQPQVPPRTQLDEQIVVPHSTETSRDLDAALARLRNLNRQDSDDEEDEGDADSDWDDEPPAPRNAVLAPAPTHSLDTALARLRQLHQRESDDEDEDHSGSGSDSDWDDEPASPPARQPIPYRLIVRTPPPDASEPVRDATPEPHERHTDDEPFIAGDHHSVAERHDEHGADDHHAQEAAPQHVPEPPLASLPAGPFEARTLWPADPPPDLDLVVNGNTYHPLSYERDDPATDPADVWQLRMDAHEDQAERAAHRLDLILERARQTVATRDPDDPEAQRANRLLSTESNLRYDGWRPEYRSEFLQMQMRLDESGILDGLPRQLVVNDRWFTEELRDEPTPWALVSPDDPTGPIGGSLRGGGEASVSQRFYAWLDENGGDSSMLGEWAASQGGGSITSEAQRFKVLMSFFRPSRDEDGYFMNRLNSTFHDPELDLPRLGFPAAYLRSVAAQHAFTHEILRRVDIPNVDRQRGVVQLMRLEGRNLLQDYNEGTTMTPNAEVRMRRGPAESFSLMAPYKDPTEEHHTLGPFWVTSQEVPLHRIFGTYFQSRALTPDDPADRSLFYGESENEFLTMGEGAPVIFHGTNTPPVLARHHTHGGGHGSADAESAPQVEPPILPPVVPQVVPHVVPQVVPPTGPRVGSLSDHITAILMGDDEPAVTGPVGGP